MYRTIILCVIVLCENIYRYLIKSYIILPYKDIHSSRSLTGHCCRRYVTVMIIVHTIDEVLENTARLHKHHNVRVYLEYRCLPSYMWGVIV